jgi:hypothetical protein
VTKKTELFIQQSALLCDRKILFISHKLKRHHRPDITTGHAARKGEMRNAYKILIGKFEGKRHLE